MTLPAELQPVLAAARRAMQDYPQHDRKHDLILGQRDLVLNA
jgi:hypothetical protein